VLDAPDPLPRVSAEQETLDYWLAHTPDLDRVLLGVDDVAALPRSPARFDLATELDAGSVTGSVRARFDDLRPKLEDGRLVRESGRPFERAALDALNVPPSRGLVGRLRIAIEPIALRCTPIREPYFTVPVDAAFDRNLCSTIAPMEPVELLAPWPNGTMLVRTRYAFGWIDSTAVSRSGTGSAEPSDGERAPGDSHSPGRGDGAPSEAAALSPDAERARWLGPPSVYARAPFAACDTTIPAGSRLPLLDGERIVVARRADFCEAPLPASAVSTWAALTRRELLVTAFAHLDRPYRWGDLDCSSFLLTVFSRFGIELPRNSADQASSGTEAIDLASLDPAAKADRIEAAHRDGIVLLELAGHIMLYLGRADGAPMVIHALADYRERCGPGETTRLVRRVAVSDLRLGEGSSRGSLLERVRRAAVFTRARDGW
jgi:hypothetical protein